MLRRLAGLVDRRARRVVVFAAILFVAAGAAGAGVASRLDPFGADDPATQSVIADQRLEQAGYRETGVVVLVSGVDVRSSRGRERIGALARGLRRDRDVASVASFLSSGSRDFVSRDGHSTYLAVALKPTSDHALNVATGLGLGLAIDYSLFIVSRYREEIARSGPGLEAMRRTLATAGRTVLFSSLTVAGALASLLVFPQRFLYSMGIAGFCVALIAAAISLTLLPAVLTLLGSRVNALAPAFLVRRAEREARPLGTGFWYRLARLVSRFPVRIAAAAALLLVALGLPFVGVQFTSVDAQVLPTSASARQVDDTLRTDFAPYRDTPITLAVNGGREHAARIARLAARTREVAAVSQPR